MNESTVRRGSVIAGRFIIEDVAGRGGMGTVYRARDRESGAAVALKILRGRTPSGSEDKRFTREAQLLAELRLPGIVSYIDHGHTPDGLAYLAMQWLEGEALGHRLRHGGLTAAESLTLLRHTAEALAVAHRRGVVHRDIKPSNLFLCAGRIERVALLDFGIARRAPAITTLTQTGEIVGTPKYMSPEQANGQREVGPQSDIFSLGCVLFECLTGKPPFEGEHVAALLAKILFQEAPLLRTLHPSLPESLETLLARMLAKPAVALACA